ncbi:MAG: hypothetical protein HY578_04480 [Nitrospinae bacterium]|nr:hypothetical protein [Nitrospinota bacterium]
MFLSLTNKIDILPIIHGSGDFTGIVKQRILNSSFDCLAIAIPPSFQKSVEEGIQLLPSITVSAIEEEAEGDIDVFNFVPIDPCQGLIAAIRIGMEEGVQRIYIDREVSNYETQMGHFPDPYALKKVPLEKFSLALLPAIPAPQMGSQQEKRVRWMAYQLHQLEFQYKRILFICSILDWPWVRDAYNRRLPYCEPENIYQTPELYHVDEKTLFFVLGELPYITYLYERKREELLSDSNVSIDGIKELLIESRNRFIKQYELNYNWITPSVMQVFMKYVRNLSLLGSKMTPDLYTLCIAAKQIGGDSFAITLLETAKSYPYQTTKDNLKTLMMGIDKAEFPDRGVTFMKNRLAGTEITWKHLSLKPRPEIYKKKIWKFMWDPYGQCSWPPEDKKIESFNNHVREQAKALLGEDLVRTEKFTTSIKDGIDIRDTLRHWYSGNIYVKEIPPSRGSVDAVVFIFEMNPDPIRYSWRQTWYAEHNEESTLCFYATPYLEDMTGPGIAQSIYGGCFMLFPPRYIPDIWQDPRFKNASSPDERLIAAALFYSAERHVALVAPKPPLLKWRQLSRQYKKNLVYIPLKRFSLQSIDRIRRFHVLNGKNVRSYAARFIREF